MSNLPEWIKELIKEDDEAGSCEEIPSGRLAYEALEIAWEALQAIDKHQAIVSSSMSKYSVTRHLADDAMRRIEEIGK